MIQAAGNILCSEIHELINSISNKEDLPQQWKESSTVPVYTKGDRLTTVIIEGYHCSQLHTEFHPCSSLNVINVDFQVTDQVLIRFSPFTRYCRRNDSKVGH